VVPRKEWSEVMIPLMVPDVEPDDIEAVTQVLRSGRLVQGQRVREFEVALAEVSGVAHVVAVSSGTAALHLALSAIGIGPGDAVAVPAYTWPATANVVALLGADPVFVDIEPATYCMDPLALERTLKRDKRIRAVMPVHAFGQMADMVSISQLVTAAKLPLIEDAACALGALLGGRAAGAWGAMGCMSFHPRKVVTTGEGGAVVTNDGTHANFARKLRNHGLDPAAGSPDFVIPGYNLRLTEIQAVLGTSQVKRLEQILDRRRRLARTYNAKFQGTAIEPPNATDQKAHTYQSYVVLLPSGYEARRDQIIQALKEEGVETTVGTHHVPLTTWYRQRYRARVGDFPVTDDIASRALTLPLHRELDATAAEYVADRLLDKVQ
jgi:dTDP-4-amino-4,6-dideoxygalactose transaminase